jgi:hypothetical protein
VTRNLANPAAPVLEPPFLNMDDALAADVRKTSIHCAIASALVSLRAPNKGCGNLPSAFRSCYRLAFNSRIAACNFDWPAESSAKALS